MVGQTPSRNDPVFDQIRNVTMTRPSPVLAIGTWKNNGELFAELPRVGYLHHNWSVLDPTYGRGTFWTRWRPNNLTAHDINPAKSPDGTSVDATNMKYAAETFDAVVIDGPYKLNGTPSDVMDEAYGVDVAADISERHALLAAMMSEGARVLRCASESPGGYLLFKCMDQVSSGQVHWQTHIFAAHGETLGLTLVDSFLLKSNRGQPERSVCARCDRPIVLGADGLWAVVHKGQPDPWEKVARRCCGYYGVHYPTSDSGQRHARRNYSTLLVFRKP